MLMEVRFLSGSGQARFFSQLLIDSLALAAPDHAPKRFVDYLVRADFLRCCFLSCSVDERAQRKTATEVFR